MSHKPGCPSTDAAYLLRGLDLIGGPGSPPSTAKASSETENIQAIQKAAGDMVGMVIPMATNPELLKLLPPPQAKMMKELSELLVQAQRQIQGKPMTPQEQKEAHLKMMDIQKMFMQMSPGANQPPPPAGSNAPQKDRKQ